MQPFYLIKFLQLKNFAQFRYILSTTSSSYLFATRPFSFQIYCHSTLSCRKFWSFFDPPLPPLDVLAKFYVRMLTRKWKDPPNRGQKSIPFFKPDFNRHNVNSLLNLWKCCHYRCYCCCCHCHCDCPCSLTNPCTREVSHGAQVRGKCNKFQMTLGNKILVGVGDLKSEIWNLELQVLSGPRSRIIEEKVLLDYWIES